MSWDDDIISWTEFQRLDRLLTAKDPLRQGPSLGEILLSQDAQVVVREMVREARSQGHISFLDDPPPHGNDSGLLNLFGMVILGFVKLVQWTGWLIWKVGALAWIVPYWLWCDLVFRLRLSSLSLRIRCAILVVLLFVLLMDHISFTRDFDMRSRPDVIVGMTWSPTQESKGHDAQKRQCLRLHLLAAPFICRTILDLLRAGHAACVRLLSNDLDVQDSPSEHAVLHSHPTPPGEVIDEAYRRWMLNDELRRRDMTADSNVDEAAIGLDRPIAEIKVEPCTCENRSLRTGCDCRGRLYFNEEKSAALAAARRRRNRVDGPRRPISRVFIGPRYAGESMPIAWGAGKGSRFVPRMMKIWVYHDCATQT